MKAVLKLRFFHHLQYVNILSKGTIPTVLLDEKEKNNNTCFSKRDKDKNGMPQQGHRRCRDGAGTSHHLAELCPVDWQFMSSQQ